MRIRLALIFVVACASLGASAQIFRTVDANGNVVFTDIAPVDRSGQGAPAQVTVPPVNTVPALAVPATPNNAPAAASPGYYTKLSIVAPAADETIRENAGNVRIEAAIAPPLRPDHRLLLVVDGALSAVDAVNGVFELSNVDRGTHTAALRIVDRDGAVLIESDPTTFHLMRVSVSPTVPIAPPTPPTVPNTPIAPPRPPSAN